MMITKAEEQRLPTSISLQWFVEAMQTLDLSRVPLDQRSNAVHEHLMRIMAHTVDDPTAQKQLQAAVESMEFRRSLMLRV